MANEERYYNKAGLKARGWTEAMIRDLLSVTTSERGKGGVVFVNGKVRTHSRKPLNHFYYEASKVETIEKTSVFRNDRRRKTKS